MSTHATTLLGITAKYAMVWETQGVLSQVALAVPAHYSMSNLGYLYRWEKLDAVEWHVCESVIENSHPVIGCHHTCSSLEIVLWKSNFLPL